MRVMVIVKADKNSEVEVMPDEKSIAEMTKFNEELVKSGVMLAAEGLQPSSKGKRVVYSNGKIKFFDGPFTETKELIAGYWLWQVKSMDEAVEWTNRIPFSTAFPAGTEVNIEIRPMYDMDDFAPELKAQDESQRQRATANTYRS